MRPRKIAASVFAGIVSILVLATVPDDARAGVTEGCCACNCTNPDAIAFGNVPAGSTCLDGSFDVDSCGQACETILCERINFFEMACSELTGCSETAGVMAPTTGPGGLVAIGLALAGIGLYASRRRKR